MANNQHQYCSRLAELLKAALAGSKDISQSKIQKVEERFKVRSCLHANETMSTSKKTVLFYKLSGKVHSKTRASQSSHISNFHFPLFDRNQSALKLGDRVQSESNQEVQRGARKRFTLENTFKYIKTEYDLCDEDYGGLLEKPIKTCRHTQRRVTHNLTINKRNPRLGPGQSNSSEPHKNSQKRLSVSTLKIQNKSLSVLRLSLNNQQRENVRRHLNLFRKQVTDKKVQ